MTFLKKVSLIALSLLLFVGAAAAQVSIFELGPGAAYTQDFDVLTTANFPLTNNVSIQGVYSFRTLANSDPNIFVADNGSSSVASFKNYGSVGSPDRALGSLSDINTQSHYYGIRFQNDTLQTITSIQVTYYGEQWRDDNTSDQTLFFSYRQSPTDIIDLITGVYTPVTALDFTSPSSTGAGALDGNAAQNRVQVNGSFAVNIPPGEEIMLRWEDLDDFNADHGLSIDDVRVIARAGTTAADATIAGRVVTIGGRGIGNVRVTVVGGDLEQPLYTLTNPLGYFVFDGLESNRTYEIRVSSKRYTFAEPARTINLSDSAFDLDFVAEP